MMKLIALYKQPENIDAFEKRYFDEHVPLVEKIPGLKSTTMTRFKKTLSGDGFYMMAEMDFGDRDTFNAAMNSPEMAATGKDINAFAGHLMTLMIGTS
ncbi:MAG: EthD family reductase [Chloroflexi bacterium]|nr:MAG: EthD family reductase [Chloroflexota bacterium]